MKQKEQEAILCVLHTVNMSFREALHETSHIKWAPPTSIKETQTSQRRRDTV